ncbi:Crp/Fnr family transcriptional regulator [Gaetbulibacter sp. M235]|uniref:Crp/Fnr family transcriptional regulator n=1 Tax=Gaetbulibacter sp. M235 TaxID=3126510 RepID=UPI00374E2C50
MKEQFFLEYLNRYIKLDDKEKNLILSNIETRRFLKGQYILQQGDICRHENFLISGSVKVFYVDQFGNQHVVMLAVEGWWVSDLGSLINKTKADYNIQCLEDTELFQISLEKLNYLYNHLPKLERFFRLIIQKAFIASQKRIILNNSLSAKERYKNFVINYPDLEQRIPQYLVASYLGMSKEFLSKIRSNINS